MEVLHSHKSLLNNPSALLALLRESPCAIVETDADNNVQLWNHQAEDLFGYATADVLGKPVPLEPSERARCDEATAAENPLTHPVLQQFETEILHRNGEPLAVAIWQAPLFDSRDNPAGHVAVIADLKERKALESALLQTMENESRRLGRSLHDSLSQQLLGAAFAAKALANQMQREGSAYTNQLNHLADLINEAVREARCVAQGLNPIEVDPSGLEAALRRLGDRATPGTTFRFDCPRPVLVSDDTTALHVYRIAQESVTDAIANSFARNVEISLHESAGSVILQIIHDGQGPASDQPNEAALAIKYRVQAIHGVWTDDHTEDGKTRLTLYFSKV